MHKKARGRISDSEALQYGQQAGQVVSDAALRDFFGAGGGHGVYAVDLHHAHIGGGLGQGVAVIHG
ncbi:MULTISPECIES: hypothetical protein [Chromobacterium]|uniref:hypothetical protein n=1 Tax=Chromobacterium TaxID=535 RepID=UPI0015680F67|nr:MULTISPECIES: hypothetical protein [Chromobacterium]MBW7566737.1 hypothetical protein [Chromobacterium subtsugae]WSE92313.1 hypothetical protein U6115_03420 [Chromobacterium subtsugae]WVH60691.1 hypothetical protein U6151_03440 [Chromobacterium subtsugae]